MFRSSWTSARVRGATVSRDCCAPGLPVTNPSCCRRCNASRTGVRLTPRRVAISVSMMRLPGDRSPCTIRSRRRTYPCSGRDPCGAVATSPVARFARGALRCGDFRPDAIRAPSYGIDDVNIQSSAMSRLDEFFAGVEEEFEVSIDQQRDLFDTPGAVIDYVVA